MSYIFGAGGLNESLNQRHQDLLDKRARECVDREERKFREKLANNHRVADDKRKAYEQQQFRDELARNEKERLEQVERADQHYKSLHQGSDSKSTPTTRDVGCQVDKRDLKSQASGRVDNCLKRAFCVKSRK